MAELPKDMPPAAVLLGRELISRDSTTRVVKLRFTARREFKNRHGTIRGGFLSAMLDSATGMAALATLADQETAVTTSLTTLFHKPAMPGALEAVAQARRIDARSIEAKAELIEAAAPSLPARRPSCVWSQSTRDPVAPGPVVSGAVATNDEALQ